MTTSISYALGSEAKIAGGEMAFRGEFPSLVSVMYGPELICGGSIISALLILTAAHCVEKRNPKNIAIVAGQNDRTHVDEAEQVRIAHSLYMHENFTLSGNSMKNDLAIILLNEPLIYSKYVQNINLPRKGEEFLGDVTLVGWGSRSKQNVISSTGVRKVVVPIVPLGECKSNYSHDLIPRQITDLMMCAGMPGMDSCTGDSGGPVMCYRSDKAARNQVYPVLCGVTSWGEGCGEPGFPGVNTKVSSYIDWIENAEKKINDRLRCRTDQFYCASQCINRTSLCDFVTNCADGVDEVNCDAHNAPCNRTQFQCDNGRCTNPKYVCDGGNDCWDGSDERKCPVGVNACNTDEHQCGVPGRCIPKSWLCDGRTDCDDNSDEINCMTEGPHNLTNSTLSLLPPMSVYYLYRAKCSIDRFYCSSKCIFRSDICNNSTDCADGMDEASCTNMKACDLGEYRCGMGFCINENLVPHQAPEL